MILHLSVHLNVFLALIHGQRAGLKKTTGEEKRKRGSVHPLTRSLNRKDLKRALSINLPNRDILNI